MAIYVDNLQPVLSGKLRRFGEVCHMMADSDCELDVFVQKKLGMSHNWKHEDHFDLSPAMRAKAIVLGAIEIDAR